MERTVLTTGAGTGTGLAAVIEPARRGFHSVGGVRSQSKARADVHAAREAGVKVRTVMLDVIDAQRSERVVNDLEPYGLVNNAGVSASGAIEDVGDDEARLAFEAVVLGPTRLARPEWRPHRQHDHAAHRLVTGEQARPRGVVVCAPSRARG
ncbi:MAG: SDR family NAD(P)-dependent oxidoreductase [Chloroflexi bacterium]|nr:MAG: SDR family NAD(P)-dependent oxidoreductase [Chloroflexota bacterium]